CMCSTMFRIDPPHLMWVLENLVEGRVVNRVAVPPRTSAEARSALDRMLQIR
ncbi:MAG TPA: quinolinate synthase NadA, partial [Vicinamibacteria bacterium]